MMLVGERTAETGDFAANSLSGLSARARPVALTGRVLDRPFQAEREIRVSVSISCRVTARPVSALR